MHAQLFDSTAARRSAADLQTNKLNSRSSFGLGSPSAPLHIMQTVINKPQFSVRTPTCAPTAGAHQLWRSQGCCQHRRMPVQRPATDDGPIGGEDLSDIMKQDMERFAARQQAAASSSNSSSNATQQGESAGGGSLKEVIDKVLIADFFLVLAILAWLGVGLAEKATVQSSTLIDAWLPLWPLVFQPAIGVLMAGALVSGGLNWLQEKQQQQ